MRYVVFEMTFDELKDKASKGEMKPLLFFASKVEYGAGDEVVLPEFGWRFRTLSVHTVQDNPNALHAMCVEVLERGAAGED